MFGAKTERESKIARKAREAHDAGERYFLAKISTVGNTAVSELAEIEDQGWVLAHFAPQFSGATGMNPVSTEMYLFRRAPQMVR